MAAILLKNTPLDCRSEVDVCLKSLLANDERYYILGSEDLNELDFISDLK